MHYSPTDIVKHEAMTQLVMTKVNKLENRRSEILQMEHLENFKSEIFQIESALKAFTPILYWLSTIELCSPGNLGLEP
jgi:hypothetical protein